MKRLPQTLEFVTISNPDEIKDPERQKSIRRQARRRDKKPKPPRPKPLKIVFDLVPNEHRLRGPEVTLVQHQEEALYYSSAGFRNYSDAYATVRPFQLFEHVTRSRGLLFALAQIPQMTPRAMQLVNFIRKGGDGDFCPLMDFWFSMSQLDSTAFLIMLANAARVISHQHSIEWKESAEAIALYTKSIQCLQIRLETPNERLSEGVIVTVLEFAYYDFLVEDLSRWLVHMDGLTKIITRRGGIHTLYSSEIITLLNFWIDISGSFIFDIPPFFPAPVHLLNPLSVPDPVVPNPNIQKWITAFPDQADIASFLTHAAHLATVIDHRASTPAIWQNDLFVSRTFNAVVHRLLSLERHGTIIENNIASRQIILREAIRLACIILFGLLRHEFSVRPSGVSQHRYKVRDLLIQHPVDWNGFLELKLWVLFTAALAVVEEDDGEGEWYVEEIWNVMGLLGLQRWGEGIDVVRGILWMYRTFRRKTEKLRGVFDLVAAEKS